MLSYNCVLQMTTDSPSKRVSDQLDEIVSSYATIERGDDFYSVDMDRIDKNELEKLAAYLIQSGNKNCEFFYENNDCVDLPLFFAQSLLGVDSRQIGLFFEEAHESIVHYYWDTMQRMITDRVADYDPSEDA